MGKVYYVYRNGEGIPAVGLHAPKGAPVLGMARSLESAKEIMRAMREQDIRLGRR